MRSGTGRSPARALPNHRQIDRLLEASHQQRLPAMFALYNFSTPDDICSGHCPLTLQGSSAEGVTILDANVASQLLLAASFELPERKSQASPQPLPGRSVGPRSCLVMSRDLREQGLLRLAGDRRGHLAPVGLPLRAVSRRPRLPGGVHEPPRRSFAVTPTVPARHARRPDRLHRMRSSTGSPGVDLRAGPPERDGLDVVQRSAGVAWRRREGHRGGVGRSRGCGILSPVLLMGLAAQPQSEDRHGLHLATVLPDRAYPIRGTGGAY